MYEFSLFNNKYHITETLIPQFEYPKATCFVAICDPDKPISIDDYFSGKKDSYVAVRLDRSIRIFRSPKEAEWFIIGKNCDDSERGYILGVNVSPEEIRAIIQSKKGFGNYIDYAIAYSEVSQTRDLLPFMRKDPREVTILRPSNNPSFRFGQ